MNIEERIKNMTNDEILEKLKNLLADNMNQEASIKAARKAGNELEVHNANNKIRTNMQIMSQLMQALDARKQQEQ